MTALALDESPPLHAPLRFFATAPVWGAGAGLLMTLRAELVTASRWSPETFALVHVLALGFMLQVMAGALLQLLPVAVGSAVPRVRLLALVSHAGLNAGTLLLVAAFLGAGPTWFAAAGAVLLATLAAYLGAVGLSLARARAIGPTLPALRIAAVALGATVALGFTLALGLGQIWSVPIVELVHLHAAWGLLGFALCLVAGVAYVVVPMFQLTPAYPVPVARALPLALLAGLGLWSAGVPLGFRPVAAVGAAVLATATVAFAAQTLLLQASSKRRGRDTTAWCWRLGLCCLLLAVASASWLYLGCPPALRAPLEYLTGVFSLAGAFPALISGMLYKIVPFLVWLHLSRRGPGAPLMHQVIGEPGPRAEVVTHAAAVVLLAAGVASPLLAASGGALFAASKVVLGLNLAVAMSVYRDARAGMREVRPDPPGSP
ncbi:MAG: hypothetical protein JNK82_37440 [Myxococcaceae bacterium]|nr:hypothetical protein [Myxococcaceae bacterium]